MHRTPATYPSLPGGPGPVRSARPASGTAHLRDTSYRLFDWFLGVRWSVSYGAFLVYVVSLVTSRLPLGTEAMAVALLALPFEKGKLRFPVGGRILVGFIVWVLVGYVISPWKFVVWESFIQIAKAAAIYLVAVNVLSDWKRFRLFALMFLGAYLYYPGRGAITFWATGAYTVFGRAIWLYIYENPNDLAGLSFLPLAFSLWMISERGHKLARLGAWASAGICGFVILITQSRGAMLALIGMGLLSFAGHHKKLRAALGGVFLVGILAMFAPDNVMDRFVGMVTSESIEEIDPENSAASRWAIWKVSIDVFKGRPVTGWGFGAYPYRHQVITRGRQDIIWAARGGRDTHSTYLRLLGETGAVGLGLFLWMIVATLQQVGRAQRKIKRWDPERATQLKYLRNALIAFMMAGVFASYAQLAFLYVHLAALAAVSSLAVASAQAMARNAGPPRGRRSRLSHPPPVPQPQAAVAQLIHPG